MNFENYKFRPSEVAKLMTESKKAGEVLSVGAKTYLEELYLDKLFGQSPRPASVEMEKGTMCEDEGIALYRKVKQIFTKKNQDQLQNEFLKGTPDLILIDKIVDIKIPFTNRKWYRYTEKDALDYYYWQLVSYMYLTGKTKAEIAVCAIATPEYLIVEECKKHS
jgi:hypothetical protein